MNVLSEQGGSEETSHGAREALRRSEERFRLVAGVTGEAIWDNDLLSGVQEWDGATEALFGYPPHQGRSGEWWEERVHPDDRERVLSGLGAVLEGDGEEWAEEYRFRRVDGSYAHVADRGRIVRDRAGCPVRMVGAMADATRRREHEDEIRASEERFRATFEAAGVGMAHVAPDGRWLRINGRLSEITGYTREELESLTFQDITHPGDLDKDLEHVRRMLVGEIKTYSIEKRYVRKDGRRVWVDLTVSSLRAASGRVSCFVSVIEDITVRKLEELIPERLTGRELDVLRRIVAGRTNPQIARELSHSLGTVKRDLRIVLCKLGASNRNEAAGFAIEVGLVAPRSPRR